MHSEIRQAVFEAIVDRVNRITGQPFGPVPSQMGTEYMLHLTDPKYGHGVRVLMRLGAAAAAPHNVDMRLSDLTHLDADNRAFAVGAIRALYLGQVAAEDFLDTYSERDGKALADLYFRARHGGPDVPAA